MKSFSKPHTLLLCLMAFCMQQTQAQTHRFLVQFKDKGATTFSLAQPQQFLSARSIERRARYGIAYDSTDVPVPEAYINALSKISSAEVLNISKWLNQVSVEADSGALAQIQSLPFVQAAQRIAQKNSMHPNTPQTGAQQILANTDKYDYSAASAQIRMHHGAFLHHLGLTGDSITISLLDAGFYKYDALRAFDSALAKNKILGTWDFVSRDTAVADNSAHGMYCLSTIAANIPDSFVGTAPEASFYLFRSEDDASEYPIEEHNWVCAAERADSAGSDLISSSLGYNVFNDSLFNHRYIDMDGATTIAAKGAALAARKGLLVLNSAGNSGAQKWKYIITPADADSVIAVGAVDSLGAPAAFSSYGPSAGGQVKPDVASMGVRTLLQGSDGKLMRGNGTSFSCPNMAGLAACLWQGFQDKNNMQIIDAIRRAGHRYDAPDDRVGYGIPDMRKAVQVLMQQEDSVWVLDCNVLHWRTKDHATMQYIIERKREHDTAFAAIAVINGSSQKFATKNFQFTDTAQMSGMLSMQYRIRHVLDTASGSRYAYIMDTISVPTIFACQPLPVEAPFHIIPNPVQNILTIKTDYAVAGVLHCTIANALGQQVNAQTFNSNGRLQLFQMPMPHLAPGVYFLVIDDGRKRIATKRFIKL